MIAHADALIEGFRPGVMERLGLGPSECLATNPRLLYARMTGWGQTGPLALTAGHDLNYIGVSGALGLFKPHPEDEPAIPPLVGDMGGGGLFMAFGLLAGVISARATGKGQVMDAAIVDGTATLYATIKSLHKAGAWPNPPGGNTIDGGRYFYRVYRCSDGLMISVGAIEPAFRRVLLEKLQLADDPDFANDDVAMEAKRRDKVAAVFATRTRDMGRSVRRDRRLRGTRSVDGRGRVPPACARPHAFPVVEGVSQPAPGPRFSETPGEIRIAPEAASRSDPSALAEWGFSPEAISALCSQGILS